jgi:hypothetical protein
MDSGLHLQPVVLLDEIVNLWKPPHTITQADAEDDQPLLCIPRGRHEWLALEQLVDGQLRVVEGQDRFAFHLMDCLYHLHYFEQEGYVGALHCF